MASSIDDKINTLRSISGATRRQDYMTDAVFTVGQWLSNTARSDGPWSLSSACTELGWHATPEELGRCRFSLPSTFPTWEAAKGPVEACWEMARYMCEQNPERDGEQWCRVQNSLVPGVLRELSTNFKRFTRADVLWQVSRFGTAASNFVGSGLQNLNHILTNAGRSRETYLDRLQRGFSQLSGR